MKALRVFLMILPLCLSASVFETSEIVNLTGGGSLSNPDGAPYGGQGFGGLGLWFSASGSNGVDTVSIYTSQDFPLRSDDILHNVYLTNLRFNSLGSCLAGIYSDSVYPACPATINGISGYGTFSNLGGGIGLVQVYEFPRYTRPFSTFPGPLLAEAEVFSRAQVTSVSYGVGSYLCPTCPPFPGCVYCPAGQGRFNATFALMADPPDDPPGISSVPEPSTGILGLGCGLLLWLRARARVRKEKCK